MRKSELILPGLLAILLVAGKPAVSWAQTKGRIITGSVPAPRSSSQTVFYVAADGNDSWTGKLDKPNAARTDGLFLTVQRAQKAIRDLKATGQLKAPVTVYIRGGRYALQSRWFLRRKIPARRRTPSPTRPIPAKHWC